MLTALRFDKKHYMSTITVAAGNFEGQGRLTQNLRQSTPKMMKVGETFPEIRANTTKLTKIVFLGKVGLSFLPPYYSRADSDCPIC